MSAAVPGAVADSTDGRTFTFEAGRAAAVLPGDLVVLRSAEEGQFLGQVLDLTPRTAAGPGAGVDGTGLLIGALGEDGVAKRDGRRPFSAASIEHAAVDHLEAMQAASGADLPIGTWTSGGAAVEAKLRAQGFGRHSFLCGQSGSGKTYALGVILEQLLLGTELRMVVFDPNADFVRLGQRRPDAPEELVRRLEQAEVRVLGADSTGADPLRMRFATLPRQAQAAVMSLDPLIDRAEYSLFIHRMAAASSSDINEIVADLLQGDADERALGQRIDNLGMLDWEIWAQEKTSAAEVVAGSPRATVLDLSGFRDPREPLAVSLDVIERLWAQRDTHTPTLIVIDEAHNICPSEPHGSIQQALVDRLIQIAAEGRKYGLWLLLSTQRPSKLHPQVVSQCDNLALMRMNSSGDVAELSSIFGFAPPAMLRASQFFAQGEVLVAGGFVPTPAIIRMGARLTVEGGSDVKVPVTA